MTVLTATLVLIYSIWTIIAIKTIIKRPDDLFKADYTGTPRCLGTDIWIMLTIMSIILIIIFNVPWNYKLF